MANNQDRKNNKMVQGVNSYKSKKKMSMATSVEKKD